MNWVIIKHTYLAPNNFLTKSCKSAEMVPENRGKDVYIRTQIRIEACDRPYYIKSFTCTDEKRRKRMKRDGQRDKK